MKKLRHIIAVELEEHGSPIESYRKYKFEGREWIEIKPKRPFSVFEFDSKVDGVQETPKILFGRKEAIFTFNEPNVISYTNFPSTYELLIFPFLSPKIFIQKIIKRAEIFNEIKKHIEYLSSNFETQIHDIDNCLNLIKTWKKHNSTMFPYMFLSLATDEIIFNSFQEIMYSEKGHFATEIFMQVFTSKFAMSAKEKKSFIPTLRGFSIPPSIEIPTVSFPENNDKELENALQELFFQLTSENDIFTDRFIGTHRILCKLQYQMTEENYYVWQTYAILINHVLYKMQLLLNKSIDLKTDLTNYTISQIETLIKNIKK